MDLECFRIKWSQVIFPHGQQHGWLSLISNIDVLLLLKNNLMDQETKKIVRIACKKDNSDTY